MSKKSRRLPQGRHPRRALRKRRARYLVVSNGAVTEKQYFEALNQLYPDVVISYAQKTVSPSQLANWARKLKEVDENDSPDDHYCKVWVVADVDQYGSDVPRADMICQDNGIEFIISNPCFEVWLLDHERQCPPSVTDTKIAEQAAGAAGVTTGNRGKFIVTDILTLPSVHTAVLNADRHNTEGQRKKRRSLGSTRNLAFAPWTDMPDIIQELDKSMK